MEGQSVMHTFNRIVMLVLAIIVFAFGATTFLLLTGIIVPENSYLRAILALYSAWRAVALLRGATTNLAVLIALLLAIIGLVVIILELLPIGRLFRRQRE